MLSALRPADEPPQDLQSSDALIEVLHHEDLRLIHGTYLQWLHEEQRAFPRRQVRPSRSERGDGSLAEGGEPTLRTRWAADLVRDVFNQNVHIVSYSYLLEIAFL